MMVTNYMKNNENQAFPSQNSSYFKHYTVKPLCIVFQGDGKQKQYIRENESTGKPLKIIDKNNLMIIITSC
jgi:hypothetical protein